jgi:uncharacterized protein involved in exopolysaccharide biosynthesis
MGFTGEWPSEDHEGAGASLIDYFRIVRRYWRLELAAFVVACVMAIVVSMQLP